MGWVPEERLELLAVNVERRLQVGGVVVPVVNEDAYFVGVRHRDRIGQLAVVTKRRRRLAASPRQGDDSPTLAVEPSALQQRHINQHTHVTPLVQPSHLVRVGKPGRHVVVHRIDGRNIDFGLGNQDLTLG